MQEWLTNITTIDLNQIILAETKETLIILEIITDKQCHQHHQAITKLEIIVEIIEIITILIKLAITAIKLDI